MRKLNTFILHDEMGIGVLAVKTTSLTAAFKLLKPHVRRQMDWEEFKQRCFGGGWCPKTSDTPNSVWKRIHVMKHQWERVA